MQSTTIPTIGTVDMRPARQEPESTVNRGGARDGAVAPKSDVGGGVPVSIQYLAVGAEVATSLADAVHASCAAVCLTGVSRINCFNPSADELCLVSQQSTEHADGNLREGVVVACALLALLLFGFLGLFLLGFALVARCVLLDILQVLHDEDGSIGRVKELLDGTVAHILAHAGFLPGFLLQSALRGLRAFALELTFEVSHLATLAKVVLIDKGRSVTRHEQAAHTEVDTYGIVAALLCDGNLKWYGEPQLAATHEDERVAGLVAAEHLVQLGICVEGKMVALALCAARDVQPIHVHTCIESGIEAHGEVVLLGVLGLSLLFVALDGAQGTAGIAAYTDNHLGGQHWEVAAQPVITGMMHSHGIQRYVILLNEPDAGIIRPCSLGEQTQPVLLHLWRRDGSDVICQRRLAVLVLLHGYILYKGISVPRVLAQVLVVGNGLLEVGVAYFALVVLVEFQLAQLVHGNVAQGGTHDILAALHEDDGCVLVGCRLVPHDSAQCPEAGRLGVVAAQFGELHFGHHLCQVTPHGADVLEVLVNNLGLHLTALFLHFHAAKVEAEVVLQHLSVVTPVGHVGFDSLTHIILVLTNMGQQCALSWPKMQSHRGITATRHGYCPNEVYSFMFGYKNSRSAAATLVPHFSFDAAKIGRKIRPCKLFHEKLYSICSRTSFYGSTARISVAEPLEVPAEVPHHPRLQVQAQGSHRRSRLRHEAYPARHCRGIGLRHRSHGDGQRPCASACLCTAQAIAFANRNAAETGIIAPHLAAARRHATEHLLERSRDILVQRLFRFQYWECQPKDYSTLYREPRLNLKTEAPFLHAAEDRVVSWREII